MTILRTENISKSYDGKSVLENINIHLMEGEIVSLIGESGSGKTTLFNILAGIVEPDGGKVFLGEQDITNKPGRISYMLQKDLLLEHKKVVENVALGLVVKGMKKAEAFKLAKEHLKEFGLDAVWDKYPAQLSGGMRQRVAFLRTYLASEKLALLDEPFSALDAITKSKIHDWYLSVMKKIKLSTIFITHDIEEAVRLSDRIYILGGETGKVVKEIVVDENTDAKEIWSYFRYKE